MDLTELRQLLEMAFHDRARRSDHVKQFQMVVWDSEELDERPEVDSLLRELAYDLDYYQPNETVRAEEHSLYGDERLEDEIRSALARLPKG